MNLDSIEIKIETFKWSFIIKSFFSFYHAFCIFSVISMEMRATHISIFTAPDYFMYIFEILKCYEFKISGIPHPFLIRYLGLILILIELAVS